MISTLLRIVSVSVVARTLGPADFGVAALAIASSRLLLLFSEGGVGTYVVRFREQDAADLRREARSAFWFNQTATIVQVTVLLIGIPLAQLVLDEAGIVGPLVILGATFVLRQMSVVPEALARRNFAYKALATRDLVSVACTSALSVVLALKGAGVYSIVLPPLLLEPFRFLLLVHLTKFRPGLTLGSDRWVGIYRFTRHLVGSEIVFLILNDGDTLVIGAVLGPEAAGLYNLAWQLASLVGRNIVSVVTDVALPTFATALRRGQLMTAYAESLQVLSLVTLPLQLLLAACAGPVITVLYGSDYEQAAPVLSVLAIFMAVRGVTSITGPIFNVLGVPRTGLLLGLGTVPFYVAAIFLGTQWGIVQTAALVAAVRIVAGCWGLVVSIDKLQGDRRSVLGLVARALPGGLAGATVALLVGVALPSDVSPLVQLGLAGATGVVIAVVGQVLFNGPAVVAARLTVAASPRG